MSAYKWALICGTAAIAIQWLVNGVSTTEAVLWVGCNVVIGCLMLARGIQSISHQLAVIALQMARQRRN